MQWEYVDKIEQMDQKELAKRIKEVMAYKIEVPIVTLPYVAEEKEIVEYKTKELTAKCPMTGIRDFYELTIRFEPDKLLPELKNLKKYLAAYDSLPISHEHLAAKIYQDFKAAVQPKKLQLILDTAIRGGIKTTVQLGSPVSPA